MHNGDRIDGGTSISQAEGYQNFNREVLLKNTRVDSKKNSSSDVMLPLTPDILKKPTSTSPTYIARITSDKNSVYSNITIYTCIKCVDLHNNNMDSKSEIMLKLIEKPSPKYLKHRILYHGRGSPARAVNQVTTAS